MGYTEISSLMCFDEAFTPCTAGIGSSVPPPARPKTMHNITQVVEFPRESKRQFYIVEKKKQFPLNFDLHVSRLLDKTLLKILLLTHLSAVH